LSFEIVCYAIRFERHKDVAHSS